MTGLPVDGSENRLVDKLQIHFLRKKNGGGEISSVTLSKTIPGTAFITFEESEGERVCFLIHAKQINVTDGMKTVETFNVGCVFIFSTSRMLYRAHFSS